MSGEKINTIKKDHSSEKLYEAEEQKYMSVAEGEYEVNRSC